MTASTKDMADMHELVHATIMSEMENGDDKLKAAIAATKFLKDNDITSTESAGKYDDMVDLAHKLHLVADDA